MTAPAVIDYFRGRIEGNVWHDQHWGDCRCNRLALPLRREACAERGANHLGRLLMELRAELHATQPQEASA